MDHCSVCCRTVSRKVISLSSRLAQFPTSPKSSFIRITYVRESVGAYLHAVSACADEVVPAVLLFACFVGARLESLGLFGEAGIVCVDV